MGVARWQKCGYFCIFTEAFFHHYGALRSYPLYRPEHPKLFLLSDESAHEVETIFEKMLLEMNSDYAYKDEIFLRAKTLELIHIALKMQPAAIAAEAQKAIKAKSMHSLTRCCR